MRRITIALLLMMVPAVCQAQLSPVARIVVCPDTSGSLDPREFAAACSAVTNIVTSLAQSGRIRELSVLPWAGAKDCATIPSWRTVLPVKPVSEDAPAELTETGQLFTRVRAREARAAATRSRHKLDQQDATYERAIAPELAAFGRCLLGCRQGRAACTAFDAMLMRCSRESSKTLCIVITDGVEACGAIRPIPLTAGCRTVIILVPTMQSSARSGVDDFRIQEQIRRRAPWAVVVPSFRLMDSTLDWNAVLLGEEAGAFSRALPTAYGGSR